MKKFIITFVSYIMIVGLITSVVNSAFIVIDHSDGQNTEKYKNIPQNIQVCNFGSSHGLCGFNYEDIHDRVCFNFALSSQTLSYDDRILKYYENNLSEGGTAYIVISFFSLFGKSETFADNFQSKNKRYYDFLPKEYIKSYDVKEMLYEVYFPSLTEGSDIFNVLLGKKTANTNDEEWQKNADSVDVDKDAMAAYKRHLVTNKFDESGNRIYNQEEIDAIYEMINILRSKSIEPILVTTPFLHEYLDVVASNDAAFFDDYYGLINEIANQTGVRYYDYSSDERFIYDHSLFMNADHLNKEGARQFTNILIKETINH